MPIIEAQEVGRPVITSNIDPMNYVGGNGALYVDPNNIKSIKSGINKIIFKKKIRVKLINNGFKNAKRFSKQKALEKHLFCYHNILNNKVKN